MEQEANKRSAERIKSEWVKDLQYKPVFTNSSTFEGITDEDYFNSLRSEQCTTEVTQERHNA